MNTVFILLAGSLCVHTCTPVCVYTRRLTDHRLMVRAHLVPVALWTFQAFQRIWVPGLNANTDSWPNRVIEDGRECGGSETENLTGGQTGRQRVSLSQLHHFIWLLWLFNPLSLISSLCYFCFCALNLYE